MTDTARPIRVSLPVSKKAFDDCFGMLVANFGAQDTADTLRVLKRLYSGLFSISPDHHAGDDFYANDQLLAKAVDGLIRNRNERGMPRVAEVGAAIEAERATTALYHSEQNLRETLRTLQYDLQDSHAQSERRKALEQCVEAVAASLGRLQMERARDRERAAQQRRDDIERAFGKDNPFVR